MTKCTIQWQNCTRNEWNAYLQRCKRTTILQAYYYAQAMRECKQQGVRHGIITIDGTNAGIVQMQEVGLFKNTIHTVTIDRGPLWFHEFGTTNHVNAFITEFDRQFPRRFGRKRRIMFEYYQDKPQIIRKNLIINPKISLYKTYIVNLSYDLEKLRQKLNKKWRNCLSKAENMNINAEIDIKLSTLALFLKKYVQDRANKGYKGASVSFLASLCKYAARHQECLILNAKQDEKTIAAILVFVHGNCATYQTGWTSEAGRKINAHHFLLWKAIEALKEKGVTELDMGGHNDEAEGLITFKKGLGGHEITLIGSYG